MVKITDYQNDQEHIFLYHDNNADPTEAAMNPLLLKCMCSINETAYSPCPSGISFLAERCYDDMDKKIPSPKQSRNRLIFEYYYLPLDAAGAKSETKLPDHQSEAIEKLYENIQLLIYDEILLGLLECQGFPVLDDTILYCLQLLSPKSSGVYIEAQDFPSLPIGRQYCKIKPTFIDMAQCLAFFQEDIVLFGLYGAQFSYSSTFFSACLTKTTSRERIPFLVTFTLDQTGAHINMFFTFEDPEYNHSISQEIFRAIIDCCNRANRRYALKELHETHRARDSLIPLTEDNKVNFEPSAYSSFEELVDLSCPLQFQMLFQLHWRLKPSQVLNSLMLSLQSFAIVNRRYMVVFSTKEHVYYMKFSIFGGRGNDEASSPINSPRSESLEQGILLRVFGIDKPNEEVTVEFVAMIESKIKLMVQNLLSTFLSRNTNVKLTKSDVDFLLPVGPTNKPVHQSWFLLCHEMENLYLYVLLVRQALLLFLRPLSSPEVAANLRQFYKTVCNQDVVDDVNRYVSLT